MTWEPRAPRTVAFRARTLDSTTKEVPFGEDTEDVLSERRGRTLERIVKRCAGLDVHKASVTACVRIATGESEEEPYQETRKFPTTTGGLLSLRDWLVSFGVSLVGME